MNSNRRLVVVALLGLLLRRLAFGPVGAAFTEGSYHQSYSRRRCFVPPPSSAVQVVQKRPSTSSRPPAPLLFHPRIQRPAVATFLQQSTTSSSSSSSSSKSSPSSQQQQQQQDESERNGDVEPDIAKLRVSEIRRALDGLRVDYSDCFDKESLVQRWKDARDGNVKAAAVSTEQQQQQQQQVQQQTSGTTTTTSADVDTEKEEEEEKSSSSKTIDSDAIHDDADDSKEQLLLQEIRQLSVKQLRQELAERNLRWAGLLEKEDLVRAVQKARQRAAAFSATGLVAPGQVADLTEDQLRQELQMGATDDSAAPILLDVFATWCGPCQLLLGQLKDVAAHMQDKLRVVKMDSDQNPTLSSQLRVQGLPTLILFDSQGQEIDRLEGALMKEQLIQWIERKRDEA